MMCHISRFPRSWGRRIGGAAFGLLLVLGCLPCEVTLAGPPTVQELVDQFSMTNYFNVVSNKLYSRQGMNRAPVQVGGAHHDLCRDAIYDEFQRVGLNPYKDPWSYVDTTNRTTVNVCNIIAVQEGVQNPNNEIYVFGAHYDSRENPGADDNATGVGCALETARIFAKYHFAKTIVFAIFDSEERWEYGTGRHRLGSLRYVDQHSTDNIKTMISVDMIGWQAPSPNNNKAYICGRTASNPLRYDLQSALSTYGDGLNGVLYGSDNMSDHYSFAQAGFTACCLIEYGWSGNTNYHKAGDYVEKPGYLDWGYLEKMCKGVIGYYATQLQPVDVTPQILSLESGLSGGAVINGHGLPLCQYAIDLCTNLIAPDWVAIGTNAAAPADGAFAVLDPDADNRPAGFYRARFVAGYTGGPGNPPQITTQPLHRVVDTGGATSFAVSASGDPPLSYQWRLNGSAIPGATSNPCVITDAESADAGDYSVVVANYSGSVTSIVVSLTVYPPQTLAFADDLDTDTSANWTVSKSSADTRCTFNYDYAADGIPSAPNSTGGTTRGVKFEANMANGAVAALSMSPIGQSFGGDYRLRFDMWINANGPFPLGGTGSTEYITGGLGTSGGHVQWIRTGSEADGYWFAVDGEGQAVDTSTTSDYSAYAGTELQAATSGVYAAGNDSTSRGNLNVYYTTAFPAGQTPPLLQQSTYPQQTGALEGGAVGFAWREVIIAKRGNIVEWSIDGVKLAAFTSASVTDSNIFVGYWDAFASISDNSALSFGLVDNVRVEGATNSTPPADIIIDNPAATVMGTWTNGVSSTDKYGADYFYAFAGTGAGYVEYRPNLQASGNYQVYEWHPQGTNRTKDAPIAITHNGGTQTVTIDQQVGGGQWNLLGTFSFSAGTAGYVRIKDNFTTGIVVMADAIKFVYVP
ncbi:MAG TPA: M28 family peptidase [Verrucomicrobiota bacterium]|nr:M28 family peptidase [Verrucomicrobiota bacterium]